MEIEMAIEIKELYTSFDTINPRQVNSILNGVCGAYSTIIKPINKELKDPQNAASIEIGTDNQVDTTTRISIVLRLTLWDKLFYNTNFSFDVNKLKGPYKKRQIIAAITPILRKKDIFKATYTQLISVIGNWNEIRNYLFKDEKDKLDNCTNEQDLLSFIQSEPYIEFSLFAKYRLSQIKRTPFYEAKNVIALFPKSDLFPIKELKSLIKEINGIQFLLTGQETFGDNEMVSFTNRFWESFINSFIPVHSDENFYIQSCPLSYSFLKDFNYIVSMMKINCQTDNLFNYELFIHNNPFVGSDEKKLIISTNVFFKSIISILNNLVSGISFSFPNVDIIHSYRTNELDYIWASKDDNTDSTVLIRCKDDKVFDAVDNTYAGCYLMLCANSTPK